MNKEQLENFIKVATGKARIKATAKKETAQELFARTLLAANRRDKSRQTEKELAASVYRGC
jgi:hypothetical protein